MTQFKIGDRVCRKGDIICTVIEVDNYTTTVPEYKLKDAKGNEFWSYGLSWSKITTPEEVLRYGQILTDEEYFYGNSAVRSRNLEYENYIYYIKMVNGEVTNFKRLG